MPRAFPTAVIENLQPLVDGGRYPIKRVVGEDLAVVPAPVAGVGGGPAAVGGVERGGPAGEVIGALADGGVDSVVDREVGGRGGG